MSSLVQSDLSASVKWSEVNYLPLSIEKCECLHYGVNNKKRLYHINGISIKDSDEYIDLCDSRTADFKHKIHNRRSAPQSCAAIWFGS